MRILRLPRGAAFIAVLLAAQLLAGCVVVPARHYRERPVVVEPGYNGGGWHDRRSRPDWDGGR
jgi:hypothetical protein